MEKKTLSKILEENKIAAYNNALNTLAYTIEDAEKQEDEAKTKLEHITIAIQELYDAQDDEAEDIQNAVKQYRERFGYSNRPLIVGGTIAANKIVAGCITASSIN